MTMILTEEEEEGKKTITLQEIKDHMKIKILDSISNS